MKGLREALDPAARTHRLGGFISLHAAERPLIRYRARWLWLLVVGLLVGLAWAVYDGVRSSTGSYEPYPDGVFFGSLVVLYLGGLVVVPVLAARLLRPEGPPGWVARYEDGLIDVSAPGPDDLHLRPVRYDQIRHVEQRRGGSWSDGQRIGASSSWARLEADRDGERLVLVYHGYRHQDRFVDAARRRLAGGPSDRTRTAARRRGEVVFGDLTVGRRTLRATGGLGPSERPELNIVDVVGVNERADGTLTVLRRPTPGRPPATGELPVRWFSAVVPDTSEAAALIISTRNRQLDRE